MDKSDYLQFCRYYKGEDNAPSDTAYSFWWYEKKFVDWSLDDDSCLNQMLEDYISYGLGEFNQNDGTPIVLKALLFNRYAHWSMDGTAGFKKWYKSQYLMAG